MSRSHRLTVPELPVEVIAFDVNETLFSLDGLRPVFERVGLDPGAVPLWFARILRDGFCLTVVGEFATFNDIAAEQLYALAPKPVDAAAVAQVTNAELMATHPFGGRIAHGLLPLGIQIGLGLRVFPPTALLAFAGLGEWRFLKPVFLGDTIQVEIEIVGLRHSASQPDRGIMTQRRRVRNQRSELVQEGTTIFMVQLRLERLAGHEHP